MVIKDLMTLHVLIQDPTVRGFKITDDFNPGDATWLCRKCMASGGWDYILYIPAHSHRTVTAIYTHLHCGACLQMTRYQ